MCEFSHIIIKEIKLIKIVNNLLKILGARFFYLRK